MVGGDHLVHLDELRGDLAGAELRVVPAPPAPTTAGQLLKRFTLGQSRAVVAAMAELGNRFDRQHELTVSAPVTLDMDGSLSEVTAGSRSWPASTTRAGAASSRCS